MHFFIDIPAKEYEPYKAFVDVLKFFMGRMVAVSFMNCKPGSEQEKPEPTNCIIESVDALNNKLIISIPLDKVYGIDTELY